MQKSFLSNLAIIVLFACIFYVLITQRVLKPNENGAESMHVRRYNFSIPTHLDRAAVVKDWLASKFDSLTETDASETQLGETVAFLEKYEQNKFNSSIHENRIEKAKPNEDKVKRPVSKQLSEPITFLDTSMHVKPSPTKLSPVKPKEPTNSKSDTKSNGHVTFLDIPKVKPTPKQASDHITFLDAPKPQVKASNDLQDYIVTSEAHPHYSPRAGSDISPQAQASLLNCPNQTRCIVPELQLEKKYKVYLCKRPVNRGVRFYFLASEGLRLHPNIQLLDQQHMYEADYIVYLPGSAPWLKSECNDTTLARKTIVLDEYDGHTLIAPTLKDSAEYAKLYGSVATPWNFMYFKRSFVRRTDGKFEGYPHLKKPDVYPMTYAVAEPYVSHSFVNKRETDLWCTLRGSKAMSTRQRVQEWIAEYGEKRAVANIVTENVDTMSRDKFSAKYFQSMYNSQIIVTVNPANWEGDFRLWEAMGSGALIFVDPIFVPHQFPLISGEHVIYFSNNNKSELFSKLDFYRKNKEEARRIAVNGYLHAMKYHRTVNLIDYVFRSVHFKEETLAKSAKLPRYTFTGQYLNEVAQKQLDGIKQCQYPGMYNDPLLKPQTRTPRQEIAYQNHLKNLNCPKSRLSDSIEFL